MFTILPTKFDSTAKNSESNWGRKVRLMKQNYNIRLLRDEWNIGVIGWGQKGRIINNYYDATSLQNYRLIVRLITLLDWFVR